MPPKAQQPSKKTEQKKKEKVLEDKTFGMKNKKGHQNQKYVEQMKKQITAKDPRELAKLNEKKKKEERDELLDVTKLLKPVEQKASKDVDPKSLLCMFFKQGLCQKGNKCKFSHDLQVEHKVQKRNLYVDSRDLKDENKEETNEDWDENKLKEVVDKKHSEENKKANKTDIVCKYFLQAVEDAKYGWFWECPNGGDKCIYRHCLPEGYILRKDRKKMDDQKEDEITIEELVEKERAALAGKEVTKITLQTFIAWKKKKLREKKKKEEEELKAKKDKIKIGKSQGMSGRDLFIYDASNIQDDEEAGDVEFEKEEVDPDEKVFEIDANFFKFEGMDDELEKEMANSSTAISSTAEGLAKMTINTELFDVDEDIEGLDSSSDDEQENLKAD
ncbi:hypothetical protein WR25_13340 [Diploscapter pachys]|uniref:C3H1-type domain-containing protein n=1 Tax=Diploscapter pachys TaxID=2018661 RepID=A0A2A2JHQ4_9BILA|nr:hypothetical protein WR25_13340 [Diploscapter pachys]